MQNRVLGCQRLLVVSTSLYFPRMQKIAKNDPPKSFAEFLSSFANYAESRIAVVPREGECKAVEFKIAILYPHAEHSGRCTAFCSCCVIVLVPIVFPKTSLARSKIIYVRVLAERRYKIARFTKQWTPFLAKSIACYSWPSLKALKKVSDLASQGVRTSAR